MVVLSFALLLAGLITTYVLEPGHPDPGPLNSSEGPRSPAPEEREVPPRPRRPFALPRLEAWVFAQVGRDLTSSPQQAGEYRGEESIELHREYGFDGVNLARIDRDHDGRFDELWRFRSEGRIERSVSTADNERYDQHFVWAQDHWDEVERSSAPSSHPHPH